VAVSARLVLAVADPQAATTRLRAIATEHEGSAVASGPTVTLRVPPAAVQQVLAAIASEGRVIDSTTTESDLSADQAALDARIADLERRQAAGEDVGDDLLQARRDRAAIDDRVSRATIVVELS
jgi:propanediol dehydratase small subunit